MENYPGNTLKLPRGLSLQMSKNGLALVGSGMTLIADFSSMLPRIKQGKVHKELLVRAAKIKGVAHPVAVDATAGLGEDSLLLAAAGFHVKMYEQNPVIAALLQDALHRAIDIPELQETMARMELNKGDSVQALERLSFQPDVVYLDPMFPARQKSAAVKKKFQLLHHLEQPCNNPEALVHAALTAQPRKIVIKRPNKGAYLADIKPSYSIAGKTVRYDVIVT